ncbi:zinc finger protein 600 [Ceratitis capitata]|uniref:Zinc finger protein 510 n=1 Tax=Ceratitis capitata TaxID=7213 RepID=W8BJ86_CERCA|nr:zinc finger protein 600 [Ceratitis capitata]
MEVHKCRACLCKGDTADLRDWNSSMGVWNESLTYQECFQICTQLDVIAADASSSFIKDMRYLCGYCIEELKISYGFLKKAQRSAHELYLMSENKDYINGIGKNSFEYVNMQDSEQNIDIRDNISHKAEYPTTKDDIMAQETVTLPEVLISNNYKEGNTNDILEDFTDITSKGSNSSIAESAVEAGTDGKIFFKLETNGNLTSPESDLVDEALLDKNSILVSPVTPDKKKIPKKPMQKKCQDVYKLTPCEYCKKLFPENKLKQHKSRYHRPKIFLCDICPRSFSIANNLRRHQRTHDMNRERKYACSECDRTFFTEDVYRTHIKIHQSSRRPNFQCNHCDKAFMHKGSLTLHLQKHTGPKNECSICQKRYVRKIDLEVHMRNHSGDLPYKCSKCEKAFMTTSSLRKHELLHTGVRFKCDLCNKEYSHPSKLSRHHLNHTGLPLKCAICDKGFAEPNKIRRHIRSVHKIEDNSQITKLMVKVSEIVGSLKKD